MLQTIKKCTDEQSECAIVVKNERLYTMQVKPRISWHGGEDPSAIEEIEEEFDF